MRGKYAPVYPFNHGTPVIHVEDGIYRGHQEPHLKHQHDDVDRGMPHAEKTMQSVEEIRWRPVRLGDEDLVEEVGLPVRGFFSKG